MKRLLYRPLTVIGAVSLVFGFLTPWLWYLVPRVSYHPGFILSTLFWLTVMLTLYNLAFCFTRPDGGERDTVLRVTESVGLLLGGFCYHTAMTVRHEMRGFDYAVAFAEGPLPVPISLTAVFLLLLFSLAGYTVLRFVPQERVPLAVTVLSLALTGMGILLLVLLSVQWGRESVLTHVFHANGVVLLGRTWMDFLLRFRKTNV